MAHDESFRWRKARYPNGYPRPSAFDLVADGAVLATAVGEHPPNNSHIAIWYIEGETGHFSTLKEAKAWAERRIAAAPAPEAEG